MTVLRESPLVETFPPVIFAVEHFPALQKRIHLLNAKWWHDQSGQRLERNKGELLCLIHSEISEASRGAYGGLMDDHLPHRSMPEVEMADTAIRIFDYSEGFGYDLQTAFRRMTDANWFPEFWNLVDPHVQFMQMNVSISNAMEGERKDTFHDVFTDRKTAEINLAFALWLIWRHCHLFEYDLGGAMTEKLLYNLKRADHSHEARARADGKKW